MIWFASDLHLFHNHEGIYKPRGFFSVEEMNDEIERLWNDTVGDNDEVYVLGDLMVCGKGGNNEDGMEILRRLKGIKHIILGNHDTLARIELYKHEESIVDVQYAAMIRYQERSIYLSHYPTYTSSLERGKPKQWIINFFGHTHSKERFFNNIPFMYNVALDAHNNRPVSIDEALEEIKKMYGRHDLQKKAQDIHNRFIESFDKDSDRTIW